MNTWFPESTGPFDSVSDNTVGRYLEGADVTSVHSGRTTMPKRYEAYVGVGCYGDFVIGQRYRVEWADCCTEGHFEACLVSVQEDSDGEVVEATFDNGVTGSGLLLLEPRNA